MFVENLSVLTIAEMACAHEGQIEKVYELVDIAVKARANAVQFQIFSIERLISPFLPNFEASKKLEIPYCEWPAIIKYARTKGIMVWANVFDDLALQIALNEDVDGLKLHSSDLSNPRMLEAVSKTAKPVSLAIGGSTIDEISKSVFWLQEKGVQDIILMHGFQAYPTELMDAHIGFISTLKSMFGCRVGYQDHTDGSSELAIILPLMAIAAGATVLEKHFTIDRSLKGIDYESSLDLDDLSKFVQYVNDVETALGNGELWTLSIAEVQYRMKMKKSIVAAETIRAGEKITEEKITFMRAGPGLSPDRITDVLNKTSNREIPKYSLILVSDLL